MLVLVKIGILIKIGSERLKSCNTFLAAAQLYTLKEQGG